MNPSRTPITLAFVLGAVMLATAIPSEAFVNCNDANQVDNVALQTAGTITVGTRLNPNINRRHVFCGEINAGGNAVGFHYRENGEEPRRGARVGSPLQAQITAGINYIIDSGAPAHDRRYVANGVQVWDTMTNAWVAKAVPSTMFPDNCTPAQIVNSIRYAYTHAATIPGLGGGAFSGPSAPPNANVNYCYGVDNTGGGNVPFPIGGFLNNPGGGANWIINSAFPAAVY